MDVFVCCSSNEGFYNPGVEAAMNGCLLWVNNNPRNGAMDYVNYDTALIYSPLDWCVSGTYFNVENMFSRVAKCQNLIREKIGSRKKNMERLVGYLR